MTIGKAGSGQNLGFFSEKDVHLPLPPLNSSEKKLSQSEQLSYAFTLASAQQKQDTVALRTLKRIGPPQNGLSKDGLTALKQQRNLVQTYGVGFHQNLTMPPIQLCLRSRGYSLLSLLKINKIQRLSYPMVQAIWLILDLKAQLPAVVVAVYFCLGRYAYTCPFSLVAASYEFLRAPGNELIWFEESAHLPRWEEPQKFNSLLKEKLLGQPNAVGASARK